MALKLVIAILIVAVVLGVAWYVYSQRQVNCSDVAFKKTVGMDFSVTLDKVKSVQGTLGLSNEDVRDFDDLLKDYRNQYTLSCRDFADLHTITKDEYNCRRDNMDATLNDIRALQQVLKNGSDKASAETAKKYIDAVLERAS